MTWGSGTTPADETRPLDRVPPSAQQPDASPAPPRRFPDATGEQPPPTGPLSQPSDTAGESPSSTMPLRRLPDTAGGSAPRKTLSAPTDSEQAPPSSTIPLRQLPNGAERSRPPTIPPNQLPDAAGESPSSTMPLPLLPDTAGAPAPYAPETQPPRVAGGSPSNPPAPPRGKTGEAHRPQGGRRRRPKQARGKQVRRKRLPLRYLLPALLLCTVVAMLLLRGYVHSEFLADHRVREPVATDRVPDEVLEGGPVLDARGEKPESYRVPDRTMVLTFDDGPDPEWTPQVLDKLEEHDAHGVFFVTGTMASRYPELVKRMVDEGHEVGLHTFNPPDLSYQSERRIDWEL
ncbi:polysaccharide deacetylase family protein, partial [Streptomyces xiaopingdaonensis]|uniref:polysaccharide deacetylase family protein n=1 Tax=Streptomyces xiaopingdaonensis TaxID=1565415 RepID=UPI001ED9047C